LKYVSRDNWLLAAAEPGDIDLVMTWFPNAQSVDIWGGPGFRFPFTRESFVEDCGIDSMETYVLRDPEGRLASFGQSYDRAGRGHLARLITNPDMRRRGAGSMLIELIIASLEDRRAFDEYSLFVYRDNAPAFNCYLSLGFAVTDYPEDAVMADKCYFLTRPATRSKP
jgi:ribosomal protein S18 acetylase RimI-like enzyme